MDLVFFHSELDFSSDYKEHVEVVVHAFAVQELAPVQLFKPRVLRLQNELMNVISHSLDGFQLSDLPRKSLRGYWNLSVRYILKYVTVLLHGD